MEMTFSNGKRHGDSGFFGKLMPALAACDKNLSLAAWHTQRLLAFWTFIYLVFRIGFGAFMCAQRAFAWLAGIYGFNVLPVPPLGGLIRVGLHP